MLLNDFTSLANQSQTGMGTVFSRHPKLDLGPEQGWHDLECVIPADYDGSFDVDGYEYHVNYLLSLNNEIELLTIDQTIEAPEFSLEVSYHNGTEYVAVSSSETEAKVSTSYDKDNRIQTIEVEYDGKTRKFKRDTEYADGVAPIFFPENH